MPPSLSSRKSCHSPLGTYRWRLGRAAVYWQYPVGIGRCPGQAIGTFFYPQEMSAAATAQPSVVDPAPGGPPRLASPSAGKNTSQVGPDDLWTAFEYLVGEYEAAGTLREDLLDVLAARFASQTGQARFELQCRLAAALADRKVLRFHAVLRLAHAGACAPGADGPCWRC